MLLFSLISAIVIIFIWQVCTEYTGLKGPADHAIEYAGRLAEQFRKLGSYIAELYMTARDWIYDNLWVWIRDIITSAMEIIEELLIWIRDFFSNIFEKLKEIIKNIYNFSIDLLISIGVSIYKFMAAIWYFATAPLWFAYGYLSTFVPKFGVHFMIWSTVIITEVVLGLTTYKLHDPECVDCLWRHICVTMGVILFVAVIVHTVYDVTAETAARQKEEAARRRRGRALINA